MGKQAISVTLDSANLTWLKGRVGATGLRSVSELLNRLVGEARQKGAAGPGRSVVGTIDIDASDPGLDAADAAVGALFEHSLGRPLVVREGRVEYGPARSPKKRRRG